MPLIAGGQITVYALHADGRCYRSWQTVVEQVTSDAIVTFSVPGQVVHDVRKEWITQHYMRAIYWRERMYNLIEEYEANGTLAELYLNVASPPLLGDHTLTFTDHELDVSMPAGQAARIVDQEDFDIAIRLYGYSPEFQSRCHAASREALLLAQSWRATGIHAR